MSAYDKDIPTGLPQACTCHPASLPSRNARCPIHGVIDAEFTAQAAVDRLRTVLRDLHDALAVAEHGGQRIVGIPNLQKFWSAYDAAERFL